MGCRGLGGEAGTRVQRRDNGFRWQRGCRREGPIARERLWTQLLRKGKQKKVLNDASGQIWEKRL